MDKLEQIKSIYANRRHSINPEWYDLKHGNVLASIHERQREILIAVKAAGIRDFTKANVLEVGCGKGGNLLDFIRFGFSPFNLVGNDLIEERIEFAKNVLPSGVKLISGDASKINLPRQSFEIVYQSMVLSSILQQDMRSDICNKMWTLLKPGGIILSYDFMYNNPRNPNVRRLTKSEIKNLFPEAEHYSYRKLTLAPPVSRSLCKNSYTRYSILNSLPFLRTHLLTVLKKSLH